MRSRNVTLHDVARESGFSKSVVSRALLGQPGVNAATAATVRQVAERLQYAPNPSARALVGARTATIGVVLRDSMLGYYGQLAEEINRAADKVGYGVVSVSHGQRGPDAAIRHLLQLQVDGLVVSSSLVSPQTLLAVSQDVPTVAVGRGQLDDDRINSVSLAPDASAVLIDRLRAKGHQHVGLLHFSQAVSPTQFERNDFTERYATEQGLQVTRVVIDGGHTPRDFDRLIAADPSVALCAADPTALALLMHMEERGLSAPGDLGVVGFDGMGVWAHPYLGLSTYRLPVEDMASEALRLLLAQMADEDTPPQHVDLHGTVLPGRTAGLV